MQISTETLDVSSVLMCGNKLAEKFASGHDTEQDYMQMLDYSTDVLLADNSAELLDAMHSSVQQIGIDVEREDEHSVVAAFIAKSNKELWEEISSVLDGIAMGNFGDEDAGQTHTTVSGYNLYFGQVDYEDVKHIAQTLEVHGTTLRAKTISATEMDDEWCINYMFENDIVVNENELANVVLAVRNMGIALAEEEQCTYNGSEVYVDKDVRLFGKAAGMMLQ